MIKGLHITVFTPEAEEMRAFLRDKLDFPFSDAGEGWLIFDMPEADMGCHPVDPETYQPPNRQGENYYEFSFYCDDIHKTVSYLKEQGVKFTSEVNDAGYGLSTRFLMPGGMEVELYQSYYNK